ncbi:DNA double-strand break repair protein Mre11 [Halomarina ordinaria]|uniref:DNA double-strand break repair protein Mre11 n=1 Tax=Halomarina ordinaria TaxID=3033939 RepID=A0ABD5U6T7_9EURY|nr:DNA double-strand break repair protein Mre11 [Halomarina sp. PSRA2]
MTRVIHTGDTHIGYQQYHRPERRADFLAAFERVVDDAVADGVDAVVHAGDLFHDRRPDLTDLLGTLSALRRLDDADVPFLAVVGNHEGKRDAQWLDLFASLGLATRLDRRPRVVGRTAFYGLDFVPRSQRDALDYEFADHDADHAVLVSHGLFTPFDFGEWDSAELLAASTVDFDALLLGDNHAAERAQVEGAWVTYCGSTERASAAERDDRGYNIVEFDDAGLSITRRGLDTREFVFVDVDLAPGEGVERVRERVSQHDVEDAVVIVTIEGDGERVTPAEVEAHIDERGALVARVNDRREFEEVTEVSVSFADPDEAVAERVRDLGLSAAARDIDEVVRASKTPDSKVADEVRSAVEAALEAGETDRFERAAVDDSEDEREGSGAPSTTDDAEPVDETPPTEDAGAEATDDGSEDAEAAPATSEGGTETVATGDGGTDDTTDQQSSMGDF